MLNAADAGAADPELIGDLPAAEALQVPQPDHQRLPGRQLIEQLLQLLGLSLERLSLRGLIGHQIEQRALATGQRGIEGGEHPGVLGAGLFLLPPGDADGAAQIAGVMEQGAADAARQEGRSGKGILDAAAGEPQRHAGDLAAILQLDQPVAAVVKATGDGIGQRAELVEQGIGRGLGTWHGSEATDARPQASTQEEAKLSEGQAQACSRSLPLTLATIRPADQRLEPTAPPR